MTNTTYYPRLVHSARILIWCCILESDDDVFHSHNFMSPQQPLLVYDYLPNHGIDTAILWTSRAFYPDTFPVLYRINYSHFSAPSQITTFAHGE